MLSRGDLRIIHGAKQAALYDLASGKIYAMNNSGARVAELLLEGNTIDEAAEKIAFAEQVDSNVVHAYIEEFVERLNEFNLVRNEPSEFCNTNAQSQSVDGTFRQVWCELTSRCNLRCLHCYASAEESCHTDLTTDIWIGIIRQIGEMGCSHLQLTGGEPFVRRDLWQIVDTALTTGAEVEIYSNLTLCGADDIDKCKERIRIATTLLGPNAEVHDSITQAKGSFSKTISAIRQLVAVGVPTRVAMIVMAQNSRYVDETLSFIQSLGVKRYGTDHMRLVGRGAVNREYAAASSARPSDQARPQVAMVSRWSFEHHHVYNPCWGQTLAIEPDGTVIPCIFGRGIIIGNVLADSLASLTKSEQLQKLWRITLDQVEVCRDCEFRYACHDCRPLALYEGNGIYARTPRCTYDPSSGTLEGLRS